MRKSEPAQCKTSSIRSLDLLLILVVDRDCIQPSLQKTMLMLLGSIFQEGLFSGQVLLPIKLKTHDEQINTDMKFAVLHLNNYIDNKKL